MAKHPRPENTPPADDDTQPSQSSADAPDRTASPSLAEQLEACLAARDANHEKWLMAVADLDNYRRRMQKEAEQDRKYAALPLARDLLPVLDNLYRAIEAARLTQEGGKLIEGVQMVIRQFDDVLARHSVLPINAVDKPFDPNLHQALQQIPSDDKPPMTVIAEYERGYTLHDRIVRPSTVIVSAPVPDKAS